MPGIKYYFYNDHNQATVIFQNENYTKKSVLLLSLTEF